MGGAIAAKGWARKEGGGWGWGGAIAAKGWARKEGGGGGGGCNSSKGLGSEGGWGWGVSRSEKLGKEWVVGG